MADIELVIKIPEETYEQITSLKWLSQGRENGKQLLFTLVNAVQDGTPLPKGHGRLIDADKLDTRERGNNSQRTMWWNIDYIVKHAPTIIEANTAESEGEK